MKLPQLPILLLIATLVPWIIWLDVLHRRSRRLIASFLARARQVMPSDVMREYDVSVIPWGFAGFARNIGHAGVDDAELLSLSAQLRDLHRTRRYVVAAYAGLACAVLAFLLRQS